jgi:hypothetical protein
MDGGLAVMLFMGLVLKIPVVFACWLIWWAIRSEPDVAEAPEEDGGSRRRFRRSPKRPSGPRRGPHAPGAASLPCPERGGLRGARPALGKPLTAHRQDGGRPAGAGDRA